MEFDQIRVSLYTSDLGSHPNPKAYSNSTLGDGNPLNCTREAHVRWALYLGTTYLPSHGSHWMKTLVECVCAPWKPLPIPPINDYRHTQQSSRWPMEWWINMTRLDVRALPIVLDTFHVHKSILLLLYVPFWGPMVQWKIYDLARCEGIWGLELDTLLVLRVFYYSCASSSALSRDFVFYYIYVGCCQYQHWNWR